MLRGKRRGPGAAGAEWAGRERRTSRRARKPEERRRGGGGGRGWRSTRSARRATSMAPMSGAVAACGGPVGVGPVLLCAVSRCRWARRCRRGRSAGRRRTRGDPHGRNGPARRRTAAAQGRLRRRGTQARPPLWLGRGRRVAFGARSSLGLNPSACCSDGLCGEDQVSVDVGALQTHRTEVDCNHHHALPATTTRRTPQLRSLRPRAVAYRPPSCTPVPRSGRRRTTGAQRDRGLSTTT